MAHAMLTQLTRRVSLTVTQALQLAVTRPLRLHLKVARLMRAFGTIAWPLTVGKQLTDIQVHRPPLLQLQPCVRCMLTELCVTLRSSSRTRRSKAGEWPTFDACG